MMTIDWTSFSPGPALVGGILLGIAAALYVLFNGRILGISGIVGGLLQAKNPIGSGDLVLPLAY